MTDTTTIEITDEQKDELAERKQHERESYKSVIARLLNEESCESGSGDVEPDEVAKQIKAEIDSLAFDGALTDDEAERLINSVGTIEERLGKVEQMVERLGGTQ